MSEKRSLSLAGHRTSLALEPEFWTALERIASTRGQSLSGLVTAIDRARKGGTLASTLRVFVLCELEAHQLRKSSTE